jgi:hypothetical protein
MAGPHTFVMAALEAATDLARVCARLNFFLMGSRFKTGRDN